MEQSINNVSSTLVHRIRALRDTRTLKLLVLLLVVCISSIYHPITATASNGNSLQQPQKATLKGRVVDQAGQPLSGVTVYVESTTYATITNGEGYYELQLPREAGMQVKYVYIGMVSQSFPFDGKDATHDVIMKEDLKEIEELVIIGYGAKSKKSITSAVSSLAKEQLETLSTAAPSVDNLFAGTVKGVRFQQSQGEPGSQPTLNIRGITSPYPNIISGGKQNVPLYVIDGVPTYAEGITLTLGTGVNPLLAIPPTDIESVDILRDAAATAIYGSRGANGVIMVKTKRGKKRESMSINAGYTLSVANPAKEIETLSLDEFKNFQETLLLNTLERANATGDPSILFPVGKYLKEELFIDPLPYHFKGFEGAFMDGNTNWTKEVTNYNAITHQYFVDLSGGSELLNYSSSFNGMNQQGLLKWDNLENYSGRITLDTRPFHWLKLGSLLTYSYSNREDQGRGSDEPAWRFRPDAPVYDQLGEFVRIIDDTEMSEKPNPVQQMTYENSNVNKQFMGNAYVEVAILPNLRIHSDVNLTTSQFTSSNFSPGAVFPEYIGFGKLPSTLLYSNMSSKSLSFNIRADYNLLLKDSHMLSFMLGYGVDRTHQMGEDGGGSDYPNHKNLHLVSTGKQFTFVGASDMLTGLNSVYSRVSYDYKRRYLLELSARGDESSKFGPKNRWGFFPAISAGWSITEEPFMEEVSWAEQLKLRYSFGYTGSTNVPDLSYSAFFTSNATENYAGKPSLVLYSVAPNESIRWEMTHEHNVGIDFSFLGSRIFGSLDLYYRYTDGALSVTPHSLESGISIYYANAIDMSNRGFELELGSHAIQTEHFGWTSTFNLSLNRNRVEKLRDADLGNNAEAFSIGKPVGVLYGYKVGGIVQNQEELDALNAKSPDGVYMDNLWIGDYWIKDQNGDGTIGRTNDRTIIAQAEPKVFGGWNNSFQYRNFSLDVLLQFSIGGNAEYMIYYDVQPSLMKNIDKQFYKEYWSPENPKGRYPRPVLSGSGYNIGGHDRSVFDLSYLRVKNITLSYRLEQRWLQAMHISNMMVFVSASNLFTLTKWPGLDPEFINPLGANGATAKYEFNPYPMSRTVSFGIKLSL